MADDLPRRTLEALGALAGETPLREGMARLLNTLGYVSSRTAEAGTVPGFLESFRPQKPLTLKQRRLFDDWREVEIVFQVTGDEIEPSRDELSVRDGPGFDGGRAQSFLFLAVDMQSAAYRRADLANTARTVNRLFRMPVIVLFRYGSALTLATVHRRASKRDDDRDVLEKVTLVKDIRLDDPHRAHIDILNELALKDMIGAGVRNFDDLHAKWEQTLKIEALNKRFYKELFDWFERAVVECRFPDDGAGDGCPQRQVIRLITRLLFIWFLKEKGLIPGGLFEEPFAREQVRNHSPESANYYRAVLQNLFFATLNTEIDKRAFIEGSTLSRDSGKYCYRDLLRDPEGFVDTLSHVPFVNGGLFDCLDELVEGGTVARLIDAFTENIESEGRELHVPARLLLDDENGLFGLFRRYKFTIEESTPLDTEVALDPELLGRVFENLLAAYNPETRDTARKETGSFYTPRPVVDYMVREALAEALAAKTRPTTTPHEHWRDQLGYLLDWEDENADAGEFFDADEARVVIRAIAELRTLDPAVGSGAFPMAILQTLTLALRRLDPDNELWEKFQKERAIARSERAYDIDDGSLRKERLANISATFEKYRRSDFGRKLYLIQNGIYGVDIQPIACQIAKLRFFISLVLEQKHDLRIPNLGIQPLPNLETRLLAADSLLQLQKPAQMQLGERGVGDQLEEELKTNRERHFLAGDRSTKLEIQRNDERLRTQLADQLKRVGLSTDAAKCISAWDPYNQNTHADWFGPEYMFGVTGGFDVVIGNPPYIQLQKDGGSVGRLYRRARFQTFRSTGDIYQLFYERGCGLLKPRTGVLSYITSNSWLKAEYGKPLREWFERRHTPVQLIEMGKDVFENAIVDTAVLVVRNGKKVPTTCSAVDVEQASSTAFPPPKREWGTLKTSGDRPWMALSSVERSVIEKMEGAGVPLREWDISIYYGIKTGYNDAFIVDTPVRDRLIAEDRRSEEIIKPILRGRDIARYRANWANMWLISTFPSLGLDIDEYPAVKRHLLTFGKRRLAQNGERLPGGGRARKKTPHEWFELQDTCAYHERFAEEKLFWMDLTPEGRFSYAPAGTETFCANTVYFMHGPMMKLLAAFLNSSLITWYVNKTTVTSGMGTARWFAVTVEAIPIPLDIEHGSEVKALVENLLAAMDDGVAEKVDALQSDIENLVYESYGITASQRQAIERSTVA